MYALLAIVVSILVQLHMDSIASQVRGVALMYQSRSQQMQVVQLAENVERFYIEQSKFPASLAALNATPGFEHTKGLSGNGQGYGVSGNLTDGTWQFKRAVLVANDASKGVSISDYMTNNACGTGAYDVASSWCGAKTGRWYRRETRERFNVDIATQRILLQRTLDKLVKYLNVNDSFPAVDQGGVPLADDSVSMLATLAGYAGSASACTGVRSYAGVPIDCSDMFDKWGGPVGYQFVSKKRIVLTAESPIFNSSGTRMVVAAEIDNTK